MTIIPRVSPEILFPLIEEIDGPNKDPDWVENTWTKLRINQPVIAEYLNTVKERHGEGAVLTGMLIYRMIESQLEIKDLEDLFDV